MRDYCDTEIVDNQRSCMFDENYRRFIDVKNTPRYIIILHCIISTIYTELQHCSVVVIPEFIFIYRTLVVGGVRLIDMAEITKLKGKRKVYERFMKSSEESIGELYG